jgi:pyruvate,orthophosphate dikinase
VSGISKGDGGKEKKSVMARKYIYRFKEGKTDMRALLGGKGADLAEMSSLGLNVPPGFTITTDACLEYLRVGKFPDGLEDEIKKAICELEKETGKQFGGKKPLLVSVRSGAPISMPGMMDTILNLGLNGENLPDFIALTKNEKFAYDCYRRFIQMFSNVVFGVEKDVFEDILHETKQSRGIDKDTDMSAGDLKGAAEKFKNAVSERGIQFPEDPYEHLVKAVIAVFESWNNPRAIVYRELNKISDTLGTAVNVQVMVFGNVNEHSGAGVAFTRNPSTGENKLYGEFLTGAQGEDVVAGIRTPLQISALEKMMPKVYDEFVSVARRLENHYCNMQDIEFTIEDRRLFILQTRAGKRTAAANVKIAVEMCKEELITKESAVLRVQPEDIEKMLHRRIDPGAYPRLQIVTKGLSASPGAAVGRVVFDTEKAAELGGKGEKIILIRKETTPDDIHGMAVSQGVLTATGGLTSHAAVVARGMGIPCVCGCEAIKIDYSAGTFKTEQFTVKDGDQITIDGSTGDVIIGAAPLIDAEITNELHELLKWADGFRTLGVRANTDTPEGALQAVRFGAEGIGLCRTERMFNSLERLPIVRKMILADTYEERMTYIDQLLPMQKEDFKEILRVMKGLPVTVRLLDPPLHEFLPATEDLVQNLIYLKDFKQKIKTLDELPNTIRVLGPELRDFIPPIEKMLHELSEIRNRRIDNELIYELNTLLTKVRALAEVNPMLGHRGVRLGITYPEIYEMQMRALLEACAELIKEGIGISPELMIPQVCTAQELKWAHDLLMKNKAEIEKKYDVAIPLKFGTMIEVVRACMRAGRLAEIAEFFSFGTNDLTQATFSFSREDAEKKFLPLYTQRKILQDNPFEILDIKGVGRLMMITCEWGRKSRRDLKIGICGEQGGEPRSVEMCHEMGLNYVSCSPFRVPVARLSAAHAKLKESADRKPGGNT